MSDDYSNRLGRRSFLAGAIAGVATSSAAEPLRPKPRPNRATTAPVDELTQLFGTRIIVGFMGQDPIDDGVKIIADQIARGEIGGVILLQRNLSSPDQVAGLTQFLRSARPDLPPLIAVDNEGGKVQRAGARNGFLPWDSAEAVAMQYPDSESARSYYSLGAKQLRAAGITLNFGPVADLAVNPDNPVIAALGRAYSARAERVTELTTGFIQAHRDAHVATCLKHFPGHGSTIQDSHDDLPDMTELWSPTELQPYQSLIAKNLVDMVMIGHLVHPRFSDNGLPASLSVKGPNALRDMGFSGPITSDDLQMDAIASHHDEGSATVLAAAAGVDMLLFNTFKHPEPKIGPRILGHLKQALADRALDRTASETSHDRMVEFRKSLI